MKTVVVTPSGRQKYLEVLAPRIVSDPEVDRWDLWLNTEHGPDIEFIHHLGRTHPKIRVIVLPDAMTQPVAYRIHKFYPHACDTDTVYVRMDDDIVWYEKGSISSLVHHRCVDHHPFLIYGNVLNSSITSHIHQRANRIPLEWGIVRYGVMDAVGWADPVFAEKLHRQFLLNPNPSNWHLPDWVLYDYERHSVNVISWHGYDCAKWCHSMSHDEEAWLAHQEPHRQKRWNVIHGHGLFAHFAFYTQRERMDATDLLSHYARLP
jgi:hypothetical protein